MNFETVSPGWSPTKARLSRRRNKAEKFHLDLSGHIDGNPLEASSNTSSLEDSFSNLNAAVETLTPEQRKLLDTLQDHSKPVRERVEAEIALQNSDPDAAQIMKDAKYTGGRKSTLNTRQKTLEDDEKTMNNLIREEKVRNSKEQKQFAKQKQERQNEARAAKAREYKAEVDAKKFAANQLAKDAHAITDMAQKTKEKVKQNAKETSRRRAQESKEAEERREELLLSEDNDVLRKLKEARIEQKDIRSQ
jgi:predicted small metal-binding protein